MFNYTGIYDILPIFDQSWKKEKEEEEDRKVRELKSGLELFLTNRSPDWPRESMSGFLSSSRKTLAAAKTALL